MQKTNDKRNADDACNNIRSRLCNLNGGKTEKGNTNQKNWNRYSARTDKREDRGNCRLLNALIEHVHGYGESHKKHADGVIAKGRNTDFHNLWCFLENLNDIELLIRRQ